MSDSSVTVFICTSCRTTLQPDDSPGHALIDAIEPRLRRQVSPAVAVKAVACLSVCKRPCTIAFAADGKWTYVIGDLDPSLHADDLLSMASKYAASESGIVPWKERPVVFRKGLISRIPPLSVQAVP